MAEEIVWEAPPGISRRGGPRPKHSAFFAALRERPGEWAIFTSNAHHPSVLTGVKRGKYATTIEGEFDATSRKNPDGTFTVYVRYVGKPKIAGPS